MYFTYIIHTNIHINTILKYTFQNGGNIIFYRNFLEKISINKYKKKMNTYIIFSNIQTINIMNDIFKNKIKINKYDISKLRFLNSFLTMNFKISRFESIDNNDIEILENKSKIFDFFKSYIEENVIDTLKKICTKYIPVKISYDIHDTHINLIIAFDRDIKIKYKYIIYLILKNKMIHCYFKEVSETYSFIFM